VCITEHNTKLILSYRDWNYAHKRGWLLIGLSLVTNIHTDAIIKTREDKRGIDLQCDPEGFWHPRRRLGRLAARRCRRSS